MRLRSISDCVKIIFAVVAGILAVFVGGMVVMG